MKRQRKTYALQCTLLLMTLMFLTVVNHLASFLPSPSLPGSFWEQPPKVSGPCAIALYGLPRSFQSLVLPSLIQNVIQPNAIHRCDYFVYFHNADHDPGGRDDRSGNVNTREVSLLHEAVRKNHVPPFLPLVTIGNFTDDDFWKERASILRKIYLSKDPHGRPLFLPYNHLSYSNRSIENVVKMWHAQQAVWNLLDSSSPTATISGQDQKAKKKHYTRVAMLRLDVVYLTPINIYQLPDGTWDVDNAVAVVPAFATYPVNDRMIYGPYEAVQVWAAQRIRRLDQHGEYIAQHAPGDGIHSERYLNDTIFPAIRQRGIKIVNHPNVCFLRARADGSARFTDCGTRHATGNNFRAVQSLLERPCWPNMTHVDRNIVLLECAQEGQGSNNDYTHDMERVPWHQGCFIDEKFSAKQRKKRKMQPCFSPHISMFKRYPVEIGSNLSGIALF